MSGLGDEEEEEEEKDRSTALLHKRNLLAGYCKLVIFGVLNLSVATDVFKHYFKVRAGWCWCWRGWGWSSGDHGDDKLRVRPLISIPVLIITIKQHNNYNKYMIAMNKRH